MDDNIWEYPFGELDDDEDMFYREPDQLINSGNLPVNLYRLKPSSKNPVCF
jgi:hypothetical protein